MPYTVWKAIGDSAKLLMFSLAERFRSIAKPVEGGGVAVRIGESIEAWLVGFDTKFTSLRPRQRILRASSVRRLSQALFLSMDRSLALASSSRNSCEYPLQRHRSLHGPDFGSCALDRWAVRQCWARRNQGAGQAGTCDFRHKAVTASPTQGSSTADDST